MNLYPYQLKIVTDIVLVILLLFLGALGGWYFTAGPAPAATDKWTPAPPAKQVAVIPKQEIKPPKVKVYTPMAKQTLDLPDEIKRDPNLYVLQATKLPSDTHPATVTTIVDQNTGEVQTYVRREPLPWFAIEQTGEARIDVGLKGGQTIGRLSMREDLLQVKALHAGINASLDSDGEIFIGIGVGYRW
jgi:hypothetical protein